MQVAQAAPMDIDAEQALLGAIFVNNDALRVVSGIVRAEHFAEPIHGQIYAESEVLAASGRHADPITLSRRLPFADVAGIPTPAYLARLATAATTVISAPDYASTIRDLWALRRLVEIADDAREQACGLAAEPRLVIASMLGDLDQTRAEIDDRRSRRQSAGACADGAIERVRQIKAGEIEQGATSGLSDLDRMIGGLKSGNLYVIAGRPGMGKSVLGSSIARQSAKAGNGIGFFSMEMHDEQIAARVLADQAFSSRMPLSYKDIIDAKNLTDEQEWRLIEARDELGQMPFDIDTSSSLTVSEIAARTRTQADQMAKRGHKLRAIVIDYLKFVTASDRYKGQRVYEVGEITRGLKALAKDLGICVVLLAQLNRQVETRQDKRPELSDLRESGDIEADADVVMLLFREAYYLSDKSDPESQAKLIACQDKLEIIIAKNRNGPPCTIEVFCSVSSNAVRNLARY